MALIFMDSFDIHSEGKILEPLFHRHSFNIGCVHASALLHGFCASNEDALQIAFRFSVSTLSPVIVQFLMSKKEI